jgi:hypothetical protein
MCIAWAGPRGERSRSASIYPYRVYGHCNDKHSSTQPPRDSATNHCLTGCVIGEVSGMALATALGWGNVAQIAAAVCLAYLFGFALTARPLVAAGLGAAAVVSTALAADTVSITIMEAIDNLTIVLIPNVMNAGLTDALFYGSIAAGFAIAYPFAFMANRYLIARGKGHAVVHGHHQTDAHPAVPG